MGKNVGLTYVKDFSFPSEQGFSGSAGKQSVKGYQRGGRVRSPDKTKGKGMSRKGMPKNVKAKGGEVHAQMGGYMGPEREIAVDDVKITVPKKRGGRLHKSASRRAVGTTRSAKGGSVHDKLKHEGKKMGYAYGGQVKDTSGEFVAKRGKQDTMDTGVQPARRGRTQQEIEAGGTKRLKPGLKKGGRVTGSSKSIASQSAGAPLGAAGAAATPKVHRVRNVDRTKGKGKSKRGFPATVKAKGGLARYAQGGYAAGDKKSHPTGRGRTPYKGYNQQPGGGGNEDARYMGKKGAARSR